MMERDRYLVVMAGGSGTRMGASVPKQFIMLDNRPVLQMTIERFVSAIPGLRVVTVLPEQYIEEWKDLCYKGNLSVPQSIAKGGLTRFHSVRNGLEKVPSGAVVAIHDGVRPFVSEALIRKVYALAEKNGAAVPAVPCVDTLRGMTRDESGLFIRTADAPADRSRTFAVQTPQAFRSEIIKEAYKQAYDTSFTDDASVAESNGIEVTYTDGEKLNIKLTSPDDLRMAKAIMSL